MAIDLPTSIDTLNLSFNIDYVQADENGILVNNNGVWNVVADGSLYDIGTVVTIGSEKFYTIGTDGDNVKLLSMYNLYVGGSYNDTTKIWTAYGGEATGMQDSSMVGFVSNNIIRNGTTAFSSDLQKGKNYSTYSGSVVEKYVNNYKRLLEEKFDINIVEARLISKEELISEDIGCLDTTGYCSNSPYPWTYSTSYWTGTGRASNSVWRVYANSSGYFMDHYYYAEDAYGVRPVIVLPISEITDRNSKIINFKIDGVTYQAERGMTWEEWVNSEYNVLGVYFDYSTPSLTMIYYLNNDISLGGVLVGAESHEYAHTAGCLCAPEITQVIDPNWDGYRWNYTDVW